MLGCYILAVEAWSPLWDIVIPPSRIEASRTRLWEFCQSIRRTNIGLSVGYKTQIQEQLNIRSDWCISVLVLPGPGKEIRFIKVALGQKLTQGSWLWALSLVQIRPGLGVLIAGAAPPLTLHHELPPPLTRSTSGALLTLHQEQPGSPWVPALFTIHPCPYINEYCLGWVTTHTELSQQQLSRSLYFCIRIDWIHNIFNQINWSVRTSCHIDQSTDTIWI